MRKLVIFIFILQAALYPAVSQELQAKLTVNASQVGSKTDKKIFQTLQTALNNFLNNRKWTKEIFQPNEKIVCNFLLTINQEQESGIFKASLTIQAARPVYNTAYNSPLINYIDNDIVFRYVEFQPIEFNENRVSGSDVMASNLTAILAYYANIIIGLDFSSFSLKGGEPYFQKAQNIVTNAPSGRDVAGWSAFDGQRNRYWLAENLTNSKYAAVQEALYGYFRLGMDNLYDSEPEARNAVLNALKLLDEVNTSLPNSMILAFFFQGRSNELIQLFRKAPADEKARALELLSRLDISGANNYKKELR